jgi:predicted phosphodiesterase
MRQLIRFLLLKPILWFIRNFTSSPDRQRIFSSLSTLCECVENEPGEKGFVIPFNPATGKYILFSDQHKGTKNGADDFMLAESNYVEALNYYNSRGFHLICLGDSEELWENTLLQVKKHNAASFSAERKFAQRGAFSKIFGNHDLDWEINPTATSDLEELYGADVAVLEAVMLTGSIDGKDLKIFCTHGHQGDAQSDGNLFSKFFVSKIWAPLQAYLRINPNTPAYDASLKTEHNNIMYEWSSHQKDLLLITGHTHQPVFESLTHLERVQRQEALLQRTAPSSDGSVKDKEISEHFSRIKPSYFNTGCCCYDDGDITGIEIDGGFIRLVKWEQTNGKSGRLELEKISFASLTQKLANLPVSSVMSKKKEA